jgi:hypothetical protein
MPGQPTNNPPLHGPGFFDDPFMIPEAPPKGEGHPRRWAIAISLVVMTVVVVLFVIAITN